jgi:tyrosyl-tRNA synthetase
VLEQPVPALEPMEAKLALARWIVARSHGSEAARQAEEHFTRVVRERGVPETVPEIHLVARDAPVSLPAVMVEHMGTRSTSEARRLIEQGGVKLDGQTLAELEVDPKRLDGALLQVGKRRFARIFVQPAPS